MLSTGKLLPVRQVLTQSKNLTYLIARLTQAFISSVKKYPPFTTQIANLIDNISSGKLSADKAKERGE